MKRILLAFIILMSFTVSFSQDNPLEKAQLYLTQKGEVTFSFTVDDPSNLKAIAKEMSIVNYNPQTKTVFVWANKRQFDAFLDKEIPFKIIESENETGDRLMSNELSASSSVSSASTLTFPLTAYPTYADYAQQMQDFATNNPSICEFFSIGSTTEGDKELLFVKLSDNVSTQEQEPKLLYTSSMHGDEIAGYPMMLDLIDYLITAYNDTNHVDHVRIKTLLDTSEVWINPNANPDGTYYNDPTNTSVANARRANANGLDLNRNYPDNVGGAHPDGQAYQTETLAFMALADANHFVISANFHGGIEVVNYPWDNTFTRHPDDAWFQLISREYADNCQANGPSGYMDDLDNGITNGADWYRVEGGRQDFMNYYHQCKETTIELTTTKKPSASTLVNYWNYNREALLDYLDQGTFGFRGVVKDVNTGLPIEATIKLVGHDDLGSWTVSSLPFGDYYRPTIAGTYDIIFEADCYQSFTLSNQSISNYEIKALGDVLLTPIASSAPTNIAASNVTSDSATISWDEVTGATYDYRYKEISSSTWTTINTSSSSANLSGLSLATQYEVQVRSICNSSLSPYSNSTLFTTTNTTVLHEGYFETGLDGWTDGGSDCVRYSGSRSYEGSYSIQLRDNSGVSSSMTSPSFNLTSFGSVEISFYYYANSMEVGEDFWLRYNDGSGWTTLETYARGTDFNNNTFGQFTFTLDESSYTLGSNAQFRLQCDASGNNDQVYIDQVVITGIPSGPDVTPPSNPTNLIASNTTETTTDLSWNASTDNIGVTGYDVYQNGVFIANTASTSFQVTGLSASTSYTFYVIARDAAGNSSGQSNTANVTTQDPPDTIPPSAPTGLAASNTTEFTTDLSWTASTDNVGVTGYDVYQDGSFIVNVSSTNYQVTGLNPSTTYGFYVIARDAAGNSSGQSNTVNVTTDEFIDTEAPSAPSNLTASNTTETTTDLSWNASTDNVGVTGYDIYQDGSFVINVSGTSYNVTGLAEETSYAFYVIARDAAGNSSGQSNTENITTLAAPTCSDGIQNGDETGIDCGGSVCPACPPSDTILHEGYFETGLDGWTEGGNDCARVSSSLSYEGSYSIRLRDNSGTSSSMSSPFLDFSPYNQVEIDFHFYANSMENGEDIWLRYNDGSGWTTVATWARGSGFTNNSFNNVSFILDSGSYNLVNEGQFRIQCDASANNDQVFIDQVVITGLNGGSAARRVDNTSIVSNTFKELAIYPNPVKGDVLNIKVLSNEKVSYNIFNTLGKVVKKGVTTKEVKVDNLEAGLYFIEIKQGLKTYVKRFIKQ